MKKLFKRIEYVFTFKWKEYPTFLRFYWANVDPTIVLGDFEN
jgi:hypothetical protein